VESSCIRLKVLGKIMLTAIDFIFENVLICVVDDGHKLIFKTQHLTSSEIVTKLQGFCKAKDTVPLEADLTLTKMAGKAGAAKKKKK